MKKNRTILCTGGIGSGKSYVIKAFNAMGVPSYDTDLAAKRLYDTDSQLLLQIAAIAGEDVLKDGKLDRKALAGKIFADKGMLSEIEAAVHPAVIRDFVKWEEKQSSGIVILESAILLEKPALLEVVDYVLTVSAPVELRVERAMRRDNVPRETVERRMSSQWSDAEREARADFVIINDERHQIVPEIVKIIEIVRNGKDRS